MARYILVDDTTRLVENVVKSSVTPLAYVGKTWYIAPIDAGPGDTYTVEGVCVKPLVEAVEVSLEEIRLQRDKLLVESDWTQCRDVVLSNDTEWATYRQALRDMTEDYVLTADPVWPTL
jgi:hypothetical protein